MKLILYLAMMSVSAMGFAGGQSRTLSGLGEYSGSAPSPGAPERKDVDWGKAGYKAPAEAPQDVLELAKKAAQEHRIDAALIVAVIQQESSFNANAKSPAGALGLMQVLPSTAKMLGLKNPEKLLEPAVGIEYGVKYLKHLADMYCRLEIPKLTKEDINRADITKVISAYNCGPGNANKHEGVPPIPETQKYVEKVKEFFAKYKAQGL